MTNVNGKKASTTKSFLEEIFDEIESETFGELDPKDQILENLAREILLLERDMTVPGTQTSDASRVERLTKFIESKDF